MASSAASTVTHARRGTMAPARRGTRPGNTGERRLGRHRLPLGANLACWPARLVPQSCSGQAARQADAGATSPAATPPAAASAPPSSTSSPPRSGAWAWSSAASACARHHQDHPREPRLQHAPPGVARRQSRGRLTAALRPQGAAQGRQGPPTRPSKARQPLHSPSRQRPQPKSASNSTDHKVLRGVRVTSTLRNR